MVDKDGKTIAQIKGQLRLTHLPMYAQMTDGAHTDDGKLFSLTNYKRHLWNQIDARAASSKGFRS